MASAAVKVVADADGGHSLVSVVGGVTVTWARVNPSAYRELADAQGVVLPEPDAASSDDGEG